MRKRPAICNGESLQNLWEYGMPFSPFLLRCCFFLKLSIIVPTILIAVIGFIAIRNFGTIQVESFHLGNPLMSLAEFKVREFMAQRYAAISWSWVGGVFSAVWLLTGNAVKKIESMM